MWICSKCKSHFSSRACLILHNSKDACFKDIPQTLNLFNPHKIATSGESSSSVYVDIHHGNILWPVISEVEISSTNINDFQDNNDVPLETNSGLTILTQSNSHLLYDVSDKSNGNNCSGRNDHAYCRTSLYTPVNDNLRESLEEHEEYVDDFDKDPTYQPDYGSSPKKKMRVTGNKRPALLKDIAPEEIDEPIDDADGDTAVIVQQEKSAAIEDGVLACESRGDNLYSSSAEEKTKRRKGVRKREEEKKKKEKGLSYINRKGTMVPAKTFRPLNHCCRMKCAKVCKPDDQEKCFSEFVNKVNQVKDEVLCSRISISDKSVEKKGRGKIQGKYHDRQITVKYSLCVRMTRNYVCKKMFMHVHGVSRGKVDVLVQKLRASTTGFVEPDARGCHTPKNKLLNERIEIRDFIDKYPRHVSHYSRRDSSQKIYLPSHLKIKTMHEEYKKMKEEEGKTKCAGYDVFREVFNSTGYKFKEPHIDTCKKCDEFKARKRHATNKQESDSISQLHDSHIAEAEKAYESKKQDKLSAKENPAERVIVFDLQQVLPAPYLSTNVAYYKRMLSTYNLTVRDCSSDEATECFMWHEVIGGRGADQIASCVFKKITNLPETVKHVKTYSDTCGGQNRNISMAIMFSLVMLQKPSLQVIDQKFLLPGHTRLECDSDHARIERAKKQIDEQMKIMVPRDWYQFVRMVRGRKKFHVVEMTQVDFLAFSRLLSKNVLIKRTSDTEGEKVQWLKIKWLQYNRSSFGLIYFKYTLDSDTPFRVLDLRRVKKGRPICADTISIPHSYTKPLGINPLKKKDLLSILNLLDTDCHDFYKGLPTNGHAREFDELADSLESASDD